MCDHEPPFTTQLSAIRWLNGIAMTTDPNSCLNKVIDVHEHEGIRSSVAVQKKIMGIERVIK